MVHSCRDGFGIVAISISYDRRYTRLRFNTFLDESVVARVHRGSVLIIIPVLFNRMYILYRMQHRRSNYGLIFIMMRRKPRKA